MDRIAKWWLDHGVVGITVPQTAGTPLEPRVFLSVYILSLILQDATHVQHPLFHIDFVKEQNYFVLNQFHTCQRRPTCLKSMYLYNSAVTRATGSQLVNRY